MLSEIQNGTLAVQQLARKSPKPPPDPVTTGKATASQAEKTQSAPAFQPGNTVMFSSQIFMMLATFQGQSATDNPLYEFADQDSDFVSGLEEEVGEVFDFAEEMDLSPEQLKAIEAAEKAFYQTLDRVEQQSQGKPLTEAQIKEIEKAADAFFEAVDPVMEEFDLSPEEQKALATAEEAYEKAVDAIFKEAGNSPLTAEQEKKLVAAEKAFDQALTKIFGPPLSEAQENRLDQAYDKLDALLDTGLAKLKDRDLSPGQERTLDKLIDQFDGKMAAVFNKEGQVTAAEEKSITDALGQFETAFGKLISRAVA